MVGHEVVSASRGDAWKGSREAFVGSDLARTPILDRWGAVMGVTLMVGAGWGKGGV